MLHDKGDWPPPRHRLPRPNEFSDLRWHLPDVTVVLIICRPRDQGIVAMRPRGSARQQLLCDTGAPAHSALRRCPPVSVRTAPRAHDSCSRRRTAGSLLVGYPVPPRALCAATQETQSPGNGVFFNRAEELARLQRLLGSPPTSVLVLTGPPSCGKSGAYSAECTVTRATPDSWTGLQRC